MRSSALKRETLWGEMNSRLSREEEIFHFNDRLKYHWIHAYFLNLQIGNISNPELRVLTNFTHQIRYKEQNVTIKSLSIRDLIPDLDAYMTYEGSLTTPGCHETVTWIVVNKPVLITRHQVSPCNVLGLCYVMSSLQLDALRRINQGDPENHKGPLGNNFRPKQPLNHRLIRTNIDFRRKQVSPSLDWITIQIHEAESIKSPNSSSLLNTLKGAPFFLPIFHSHLNNLDAGPLLLLLEF